MQKLKIKNYPSHIYKNLARKGYDNILRSDEVLVNIINNSNNVTLVIEKVKVKNNDRKKDNI